MHYVLIDNIGDVEASCSVANETEVADTGIGKSDKSDLLFRMVISCE